MKKLGIKYRINKYKYELLESYGCVVEIHPEKEINNDYVFLGIFGTLVCKKGYAWDGASGPAVDTTTIIRGSLVHDALYQLIKLGLLDKKHRKAADRVLRRIAIEDGMGFLRAWYVYFAVRLFGGWHLKIS